MLGLYYPGMDAGNQCQFVEQSTDLCLIANHLIGGNNESLAYLHNGLWRTPERDFPILIVAGNVILRFEDDLGDGPEAVGPFESIRIANGSIWVKQRLIAGYIELQEKWARPLEDELWPIVRIEQ